MELNTKTVMGYSFVDAPRLLWTTHIQEAMNEGRKTFIVTANPELVLLGKENASYDRCLREATYIAPDGVGVLWAAKRYGTPLTEVLPGIALVEELLAEADRKRSRVFFYGAKPEVQAALQREIASLYPGIDVVGSYHGYAQGEEVEALTEACVALNPDLVLVGLGAPRQEEWIASVFPRVTRGVFIGVGGSFDVLSNTVERAPRLFLALKMEWVYRVFTHPRGRKKLWDIVRFVWKVRTKSI